MGKDTTNNADQNQQSDESLADKVEDLSQRPVSESEAEAVKGGSIVYQTPQIMPGGINQAPAAPQFKL